MCILVHNVIIISHTALDWGRVEGVVRYENFHGVGSKDEWNRSMVFSWVGVAVMFYRVVDREDCWFSNCI
jgi:hypothetical protein